MSLALAGRFFTREALGKPPHHLTFIVLYDIRFAISYSNGPQKHSC